MSENLTKRDIVVQIHKEVKGDGFESSSFGDAEDSAPIEVPQKVIREVVQRTLDVIADALAEGRSVELRNFGVFEIQVRKERVGRNPNKPKKDVMIPQRAVIKFKAGKELKARLQDLDTNAYLAARDQEKKARKSSGHV